MECSSRCVKDDINLGLIAREFLGGGHPKAAGFSAGIKEKVIEYLFPNKD